MGRLVHFEIEVDNIDRAIKFYREVFGWTFEDWSEYTGVPYYGATTGDDNELGINGGLVKRQGASRKENQAINGYTCTMAVENYDLSEQKILDNGGQLSVAKHALPGMAWQGYYYDTEGNLFGIHQPDENAK